MKKCPLKPETKFVDYANNLIGMFPDRLVAKVFADFGHCDGESCMAYKDGVCMIIKEEKINEDSNCCRYAE